MTDAIIIAIYILGIPLWAYFVARIHGEADIAAYAIIWPIALPLGLMFMALEWVGEQGAARWRRK